MGEGEDSSIEVGVGNGNVVGWTVKTEKREKGTDTLISKGKRKFLSFLKANIWIKVELVTQIKLAVPIILSLVFQNLLLLISLVFVGHISDHSLELDSAALATSFANITGISVGIGLSSAADTLCAQTFGYKNYKKVGHIFQRGVLILFLLTLFVWVVWLNTDTLLLLLQQSPCVARLSGTYVQIFALCLPPFFVYWMLQKYLQAQSIVWPFIFTGLLTNVVNAIFHAIFVLWAGWGVNGAALSMVLSYYCFPIFIIVYVRLRKLHTQTWNGWSWESLRGWGQFFRLGLPGLAMTCLEWVSYEIAAFVLGSISEVELAVNSIMVNVIVMLFMIPLGISIAAGVRVGNELGASQPQLAKRASYVAMGVVLVNTLIQIIFLQSTKTIFGRIYTQDEEVLEKIPLLVDVLCVLMVADQLQLSLRGVILGCGRQLSASVINFVAFYIIGLPIGISLALLTNLGSRGMWSGLAVGAYFQTFCLLVLFVRLNWKKESEKAILRSQDNDQEEKALNKKEKINKEGGAGDLDNISTNSSDDDNVHLLKVTITDDSKDDIPLEEIELNELTEDETPQEEEEEMTSHDDTHLLVDSSIISSTDSSSLNSKRQRTKFHIKLLLTKGSIYLIGLILVVIAGIASQFHPPDSIINGNYSECTSEDTMIDPFPTVFSSSSIVSSTPGLDLHY